MPKVKKKERILKAVREKQLVTYNRATIRLSVNFLKELLQARRDGLARNIESDEKQEPTT